MDKIAIERECECYVIKPLEPIGWLYHAPTHTRIAVYHYIPPFQRWCMKVCFGLEYEEVS